MKNLLIDKNNDRVWDTNTTLSPGTTYEYQSTYVQAGSRLLADKPIAVYQRASLTTSCVGDACGEYWGFEGA